MSRVCIFAGLTLVAGAIGYEAHRLAVAGEPTTPRRVPVFTETLNSTHELYGPLGRPLGEMMTVTMKMEGPQGKSHFDTAVTVTTVNGYVLPRPVKMPATKWIHGNLVKSTPPQGPGQLSNNEWTFKPGQEITVRAYQDGGMLGIPDQAMKETVVIAMSAHHFATWLVPINEVRPQPK